MVQPERGRSEELDAPAPDVAYGRGFLDVRRYNRVSPTAQVNLRLVAGGWLHGDALPAQRRLSLGGAGTLPGYDFLLQAMGGDIGFAIDRRDYAPYAGGRVVVVGGGQGGGVDEIVEERGNQVERGEPLAADRVSRKACQRRRDDITRQLE